MRSFAMDWLRDQVRTPKTHEDARRVLDRIRLGSRAGGAIAGVRILAGPASCPACRAVSGIVFDPEQAPEIPIAACTGPAGCRCAYATVMAYEADRWAVDHRPKPPDYARPILARLRLAVRAGGAIAGVRILAGPASCPACRAVSGIVFDPEQAPEIPIAACTGPAGCRCAYAAVMAYDVA
jgi:hypothetical protein